MSPEITILVINHNTRHLLQECLHSIARYAQPVAETIVIDNASSDGSVAMVRSRFPSVCLITNEQNLGYPKAVNQGLRAGQGLYFFILNADVQLTEGTLPTLLAYLKSHPHVGVVAPVNVTPDGEQMLTVHNDVTLGREILRNLFFTDVWRYRVCGRALTQRLKTACPVNWVTGSALLVHREVLEAVGGMDEAVFLYGEEYDWQLRARKAGWEVHFVPEAVVIHHKSASADQVLNERRYALVTRSTYYFFVKHHGWWGLPILILAHCFGSCLRMVLWGIAGVLRYRSSHYQVREHALVVRDVFNPQLYRWLFRVARRSTDTSDQG